MAVPGRGKGNNTGQRMSRSREGGFSMACGSVTISNAIMAAVNIISAKREYCRSAIYPIFNLARTFWWTRLRTCFQLCR
jgi:hypothetical protein